MKYPTKQVLAACNMINSVNSDQFSVYNSDNQMFAMSVLLGNVDSIADIHYSVADSILELWKEQVIEFLLPDGERNITEYEFNAIKYHKNYDGQVYMYDVGIFLKAFPFSKKTIQRTQFGAKKKKCYSRHQSKLGDKIDVVVSDFSYRRSNNFIRYEVLDAEGNLYAFLNRTVINKLTSINGFVEKHVYDFKTNKPVTLLNSVHCRKNDYEKLV